MNGDADHAIFKLAGVGTPRSELEEEIARAIKFLNAVVLAVRYPGIAGGIEGNVDRSVKLAGTGARGAEFEELRARCVVNRDAVAVIIDQPDAVLVIDGDAPVIAADRRNLGKKITTRIIFNDTAIQHIRYPGVLVAIKGDAGRIIEPANLE